MAENKSTPLFSIVIAVYNEGDGLYLLIDRINKSLAAYEGRFEVVLVDDRSPDHSWEVLKELAEKQDHLKVMRFCRNFGQHSAISAGLRFAKGDFAVLMDCDLQDEPEHIIPMYEKLLKEDKMIVYARRIDRQHKFFKVLLSNLFHKTLSWLSGIKDDPTIGTFRILRKKVVDSFVLLPENRRYVGGLFFWMGFEYTTFDVEHKARIQGESNYNFSRMLKLAKLGILSFSTKLLSLGIYLGFFSSVLAIIIAGYYLGLKFFYNGVIPGFTALVVSIYLVGGVILIVLGVIGEYLGEIFKEVKGRPNYIIEETKNLKE